MPFLIGQCPSCAAPLEVLRLGCPHCGVGLEGHFELGPLERLSPPEQQFVAEFVKASGSLKEIARRYGVSYPTVRNRLDELIAHLGQLQQESEAKAAGPGEDHHE